MSPIYFLCEEHFHICAYIKNWEPKEPIDALQDSILSGFNVSESQKWFYN